MSAQFNIKPSNPRRSSGSSTISPFPRFIAATLVARGIDTAEEAYEFLSPSLERDWRERLQIPGLEAVVDALEDAVRSRKHVVVFGDFDLDGISATTVLTRGLRALGGFRDPVSSPVASTRASGSRRRRTST